MGPFGCVSNRGLKPMVCLLVSLVLPSCKGLASNKSHTRLFFVIFLRLFFVCCWGCSFWVCLCTWTWVCPFLGTLPNMVDFLLVSLCNHTKRPSPPPPKKREREHIRNDWAPMAPPPTKKETNNQDTHFNHTFRLPKPSRAKPPQGWPQAAHLRQHRVPLASCGGSVAFLGEGTCVFFKGLKRKPKGQSPFCGCRIFGLF